MWGLRSDSALVVGAAMGEMQTPTARYGGGCCCCCCCCGGGGGCCPTYSVSRVRLPHTAVFAPKCHNLSLNFALAPTMHSPLFEKNMDRMRVALSETQVPLITAEEFAGMGSSRTSECSIVHS